VLGDKESLIQLFLNIVKNSAEALKNSINTPPLLTLSTSYVQSYNMRYRHKTSLPLCVMIEDNAGGIPANIAENLFDPLTSTKSDGHGLGLAIAAKITRDHRGIIELSANSENRTCFSVLLPVAR
jgi:two-component system nitrogen regulation sensor histidine kinase GlnL